MFILRINILAPDSTLSRPLDSVHVFALCCGAYFPHRLTTAVLVQPYWRHLSISVERDKNKTRCLCKGQ
jgi:hypothetical protein